MVNNPNTAQNALLTDIRQIVEQARGQVKQAVNTSMVCAYWQIGQLIVEDEQQGQARVGYGEELLKNLSQQLTTDFGKGFSARNLRNMHGFYLAFPIWQLVSTKLSWSHFIKLISIENELAPTRTRSTSGKRNKP